MISSINDCTILYNGVKMPWLGLGVWQSQEGKEVETAVSDSLDLGYRHVDTAMIYQNETGVGNALRNSGLARDQIFLTTKVWNSDQGYQTTKEAFDRSCQKLQVEQMDLYLIHWPVKGKFIDTWRALEELYDQGKCRAIGVSNFMIPHLEELLSKAEIIPMVNQVEFHPYLVQPELLRFCSDNNIQIEAWSPIMQGKVGEVELLNQIGDKYQKSAAQIALRWDLQHNVVTIPKTIRKARMAENADLFDFELTEEEMDRIDNLDRGHRFGPDPFNFDF